MYRVFSFGRAVYVTIRLGSKRALGKDNYEDPGTGPRRIWAIKERAFFQAKEHYGKSMKSQAHQEQLLLRGSKRRRKERTKATEKGMKYLTSLKVLPVGLNRRRGTSAGKDTPALHATKDAKYDWDTLKFVDTKCSAFVLVREGRAYSLSLFPLRSLECLSK